mgnify:CR=1 FL=1
MTKGVLFYELYLPQYHEPDFQETRFQSAPEARFEPAPRMGWLRRLPRHHHLSGVFQGGGAVAAG